MPATTPHQNRMCFFCVRLCIIINSSRTDEEILNAVQVQLILMNKDNIIDIK